MDIFEKIEARTVTAADFNCLIELTAKSVGERVRRVTEPLDHNRLHTSSGHSRVAPNLKSRTVTRKGGGGLNDPRRTGRGRSMLRRQATKHESVSPSVGFITHTGYEPVCPHCRQEMPDKHCVRDGDNSSMYRHRGDCYDAGPFRIEWPQSERAPMESRYDEAVQFLKENNDKAYDLDGVRDKEALRRLTVRMLSEQSPLDRDWLYDLHRGLGGPPTADAEAWPYELHKLDGTRIIPLGDFASREEARQVAIKTGPGHYSIITPDEGEVEFEVPGNNNPFTGLTAVGPRTPPANHHHAARVPTPGYEGE